MGNRPPNPRYANISVKERQAQALELRKAGMTYQQIADALGYGSHSAAQKAIQSGIKAIVREPAEELRTLELERLDKIIASHWANVLRGDYKSSMIVLRAQERRAAYLGLDAPRRIDITHVVDQAADEFGLTEAEKERLLADVQAYMAEAKVSG